MHTQAIISPHTVILFSCLVLVSLVALQLDLVTANAKGSNQSKKCQQYGHSCLGGHGKRSSGLGALPSSAAFHSISSPSHSTFRSLLDPASEDASTRAFATLVRLPLMYSLMKKQQQQRRQQQQQQQQQPLLDQDYGFVDSSEAVGATSSGRSSSLTGVDEQLRSNLISLLNSPIGRHLYNHLPSSVLRKLNIDPLSLNIPTAVNSPSLYSIPSYIKRPSSIFNGFDYDDLISGEGKGIETELDNILSAPVLKNHGGTGSGSGRNDMLRARRSVQDKLAKLAKPSASPLNLLSAAASKMAKSNI